MAFASRCGHRLSATVIKAREKIRTKRLLLRKPVADDAKEMYRRYASDDSVGPYVSWPIHRSIDETRAFIDFSDAEWEKWPAGPYLVESLQQRRLIGSMGLTFESPVSASTGYVIARDSWGKGYATEAVRAIQQAAADLGLERVHACCHPNHAASRRVLEKCGFELEGTLRRCCKLPNLLPGMLLDVVSYAWLPLPEKQQPSIE